MASSEPLVITADHNESFIHSLGPMVSWRSVLMLIVWSVVLEAWRLWNCQQLHDLSITKMKDPVINQIVCSPQDMIRMKSHCSICLILDPRSDWYERLSCPYFCTHARHGLSYSWATKNSISHGNEILSKESAHLIHGPCNQCRGPQQYPACHQEPWRSPDCSKEMEAEVVRTCLPIIFARHCEGSKKKGKTIEAVGRQRQRVDKTQSELKMII